MSAELPPALLAQRDDTLAAIRAAFKGARRAGGVSWSEAKVIDDYGSEGERAAARSKDTDRSWQELVDDGNWECESGIGGFSFLDAIGFAYYLPAAMTRCALEGSGGSIAFALTLRNEMREHRLDKWRALDDGHGRAIAQFLRYMISLTEHRGDDIDARDWREAFDSYWSTFV